MVAGFEWVERFSGSFSWPSSPSREEPASFLIRAVVPSLRDVVLRRAELVGTVRAPGLAALGSVVGALAIDPGPVVVYSVAFAGDDERALTARLEKRGFSSDAYAAATTIVGTVVDSEGEQVASLRLRVDVRGGSLFSDLRLRG